MKLLLILFTLCTLQTHAQDRFFIKDGRTKEAIPFVKVLPNAGDPFFADLDGMFEVSTAVTTVVLSYNGYKDTTVVLVTVAGQPIYLKRDVQEVGEVVAKAGENPAHPIIQKVMDNRKKNHPLKNDAFQYRSYSKFVFDMNTSLLEELSSEQDTMMNNVANYLTKQHFFVVESASRRTFLPPNKDREEIIAFKLSGLSDPALSTFAQSMQSFSFYDKQFLMFGEQFINPIAPGGLDRYLFILEDTTYQQQDTTYTIYFRPRKGKDFDGLEGRLYISTNGYAIEKVNATAYKKDGDFDVKIVQEYAFIDGKKWFPVKLSTDMAFGLVETDKDTIIRSIIGRGNSYIDSIDLSPENIRKGAYDNIDLYTSPEATELSEEEWEKLRKYSLTDKEARTHVKTDSISKEYNFERRLEFLKTLGEGKIALGYFNLPIERIINFNNYEGYRFGAGLETSKKISKHFMIGGYFGWATRDKEWKWGGYSTIHISRKRNAKINLKYHQDLLERGGHTFTNKGFNINEPEAYRLFYITNMERQRLGEVSISSDIKANMNLRVFGNYQRIGYTTGYVFSPSDTTLYADPLEADLAETGIELQWNILEKYMLLGDSKFSEGKKYPSINIKAVRGWKGWWESNYDYWRFNASISQKFSWINVADIFVKATASKTIGNVPLFLHHAANGTGFDWSINVMNSFQTIVPNTVYATEKAAFFTYVKFKSFHTKAKWNEPRFSLHHALGYGTFEGRSEHNALFRSMDKGYYEAGIIFDGIWTPSNAYGLGLGAFYRYGFYADTDWKNNIVPKISFTLAL